MSTRSLFFTLLCAGLFIVAMAPEGEAGKARRRTTFMGVRVGTCNAAAATSCAAPAAPSCAAASAPNCSGSLFGFGLWFGADDVDSDADEDADDDSDD